MILEQLSLNNVEEIKTNNLGDLSEVAAVLVELTFKSNNRGGLGIPEFRRRLREKAVSLFYGYFAPKGIIKRRINENIVQGKELNQQGNELKLERVEFINTGEEDCEEILFQKVFFIPLNFLEETLEEYIPEELPTSDEVKICDYENFKTKVKFIENFMKINFIALQRPQRNRVVRGINFRKFSIKNKKLTSLLNSLDGIIATNPKAENENIIVYFSGNYQTIAKIEYQKENTPETRIIFTQTPEEFKIKKYKNFNDQRANYYMANFDSIYPRVFGNTFKGKINFYNLIADDLLAPGVTIESNSCSAIVSRDLDGAGGAIGALLANELTEKALDEVRPLLEGGPFKTAEDLAKETNLLLDKKTNDAIKGALKEFRAESGKSISKELKQFMQNLNNFDPEQEIKDLGKFVNTFEWNQIIAISLASIASRYGIDNILDDDFVKTLLVERISKTFNDTKTFNVILDSLSLEHLQAVAVLLETLTLDFGEPQKKKKDVKADLVGEDVSEEDTFKNDRDKFLGALSDFRENESVATFQKNLKSTIINLTDCDRQGNADLYRELITFIVLELGAPILDYFDEWSDFLNAWDIRNLDFCNLPDLNIPKFKLFPIRINIPDLSIPDLFKFIFDLIKRILFALLSAILKALVNFLLSLIPDFIFDFEPCEFANALRDFGAALSSAICNGINNGDVLGSIAQEGCKLFPQRLDSQDNTRRTVEFVSAGCKGLLPGPDLSEMLSGNVTDITRERAAAYFRATGANENFIQEITSNDEILSEVGGAIGQVIGFGDLLDALDEFQPLLPVSAFDLCADPELERVIEDLCANDNPELREQLLEILENQRQAEKNNAAKTFGYLSDPNTLRREIEDATPNLAHPSIIIPPIVKESGRENLPVVKNRNDFALKRDEQKLKEINETVIDSSLNILDGAINAYGSGLSANYQEYQRKILESESAILGAVPTLALAPPITDPIGNGDYDGSARAGIINRVYSNDNYNQAKIPSSMQAVIDELSLFPTEETSTNYFEVGKNYFQRKVSQVADNNNLTGGALSYFSNIGSQIREYRNPRNFMRDKVKAIALPYLNLVDDVNFNALAVEIRDLGFQITIATLPGGEEIKNLIARDVEPTSYSNLSSDNSRDRVRREYFSGSLSQDRTYKRFIETETTYSDLLLAKTDAEVAVLEEIINKMIVCIAIQRAHIIQTQRNNNSEGQIFIINDLFTNFYNDSSLMRGIKEELNLNLQQLVVRLDKDTVLTGAPAVSYYLYEINKVKGNLDNLEEKLGRTPLPSDLLNFAIQDAVNLINASFDQTPLGSTRSKATSVLETNRFGARKRIFYPFTTPLVSEMNFGTETITGLKNAWELTDVDGSGDKDLFLASSTAIQVSIKADSPLGERVDELDLSTIITGGVAKTALLNQLVARFLSGAPILLNYSDVFDDNRLRFMRQVYTLASRQLSLDQEFEEFIYSNFDLSLNYKLYTSFLNESVRTPESFTGTGPLGEASRTIATTARARLLEGEKQSLGLYGGNSVSVVHNTNAFEEIYNVAFSFIELASMTIPNLTKEMIEQNDLDRRENRIQFLKNYFSQDSQYPISTQVQQSGELNLVLSAMFPIANIINEATTYFVGRVESGIDFTDPNDIRGIIFSNVENQKTICSTITRINLLNE